MEARAPSAARTQERDWWLRALAVLQSPAAVFAALRDDGEDRAGARQEPIVALVLLAGVATILSTSATGRLLDDPQVDGALVAVLSFLTGGIYGIVAYWVGGGAVYLGVRGAGGAGSYRRARHVLAYAVAPLALSLAVWPVRLAVYGSDTFRTGGSDEGGAVWVFRALELGFVLWALTLLVVGVRVVHGWSVPRALGALVLAAFALLALAALPFLA